jgi:electron transfer flavoprotein alpha subunit
MSQTLVLALASDGGLDPVVAEAVSAAASLGDPIVLGIVARDPETIASMTGFDGVTEVVGVRVPEGATPSAFDLVAARALLSEIKAATVVAGFDARTAALAGTLAAESDAGLACNVVKLAREAGHVAATRTLYGGKAHAEVQFDPSSTAIILTRASAWPAAATAGALPCRVVDAGPPDPRIRHLSFLPRPASGYDLTKHDVILAVGRGVGSKDNIALFSEIADKLGAALAASRPLVDAGWLPRDHQVGQSGVTVAPRVYLAFGISGALQHLAGIRGARTVIAVNSDGEAPIFANADFGAVVDMFELAAELKKQLA